MHEKYIKTVNHPPFRAGWEKQMQSNKSNALSFVRLWPEAMILKAQNYSLFASIRPDSSLSESNQEHIKCITSPPPPPLNDHRLILLTVVGDSVFGVHALRHFHMWTFLSQLYQKGPKYFFSMFFIWHVTAEDKEHKEWPVTWA